ncbi:endolytic transglycosylase MltG [Fodinicola acaciae]|uniref:endolytic transglycosylase MltG n=1 Tax=Fodinicola acaciae TaxID=2681555 RepID=UPI0013CF4F2D|nr:endolytic transglycosylase MltG [Fodinicola acaciae]
MSEDLVGLPFGDEDERDAYAGAKPPRGRRPRSKHRRPRGKGRNVVTALIVVVILGVLGGGLWYGGSVVRSYIYGEDYDGPGDGKVTIQVTDGQTLRQVGATLVSKGVVKSVRAFTNAAEADSRSSRLQPGTYQLKLHMKATDAVALLLDPSSRLQLTFIVTPGMTVKRAFQKIAENTKITVDQLNDAAKNPAAIGLPDWAGGKLEGFLHPETYTLEPGDTATTALKKMVGQTMKILNDINFVAKSQQLGKQPYDVLKIASLIIGEGIPSDYGKISQVIYNRIDHNAGATYGLLQMDSTTVYGRQFRSNAPTGNPSQAEKENAADPYSTYKHKGLPPTPIGNPDQAALVAAINPTPGPWYFFVVIDKQGNSAFAATYAEHQNNIRKAKANGAIP